MRYALSWYEVDLGSLLSSWGNDMRICMVVANISHHGSPEGPQGRYIESKADPIVP